MNAKTRSVVNIALGLLIGLALAAILARRHPSGAPQPLPASPSPGPADMRGVPVDVKDPPSPAVLSVAGQFVCACGECGDKPLATCDCPHAAKARAFIAAELAAGRSPAQVAAAVEQRYGRRKTPAAALAGTVGLMSDEVLAQQLVSGGAAPASAAASARRATPADRSHIFSHFRCPCGQCDMDQLAECECPHPNGALEVKRYVDQLIAAQQHSVGEIVGLVEQRYGGRIR